MENVMKQVEGGVCAAKGFSANGLNCGLNPNKEKNDLALIYSEKMCNAAAVYTTNKVKGAPNMIALEYWGTRENTQYLVKFEEIDNKFILKSFGMVDDIPADWDEII